MKSTDRISHGRKVCSCVALLLFVMNTASAFTIASTEAAPAVFTPSSRISNRYSNSHMAMTATTSSESSDTMTSSSTITTKSVVSRVAVAGATGRTGRLVVQELMDRGVQVVAMVRDMEKAKDVFSMDDSNNGESSSSSIPESWSQLLTITPCDLTSESEIEECLRDCDAAIWCATGFSESPAPVSPSFTPAAAVVEEDNSFFGVIQRIFGVLQVPQQANKPEPEPLPTIKTNIDTFALPVFAKCFATAPESDTDTSNTNGSVNGNSETSTTNKSNSYPKVILLSSAGVTRPAWDDAKKTRFPASADIPIVRLNPFGILGLKAASEESLRQSSTTPYCIVRPAGLNDKDWPSGSRPVFSQGDVAVGRVNRRDVARVVVDVLSTPEATGKTFEVITLAGYPPAESIGPALQRLKLDAEMMNGAASNDDNEAALYATYVAMQQLLPGEKQDSANIALGQTYEQMDRNQEGRFGPRGAERVEQVNLAPSA